MIVCACRGTVGDEVVGKTVDKALDEEMTVEWKGEPLDKVVAELREKTGTNLVVNWTALRAAGITRESPVFLRLKDVPYEAVLKSVLRVVATRETGLNYGVGENVVEVTTNAELGKAATDRLYDVTALLKKSGDPEADSTACLKEILRTALAAAGERAEGAERGLAIKDGMLVATVSKRGQGIVQQTLAMLATPMKNGMVVTGAVESARAKRTSEALKKWMDTAGKLPLGELAAGKTDLNVLVLPGWRAAVAGLDSIVDETGIVEIGTPQELAGRVVAGAYDLTELLRRRVGHTKKPPAEEMAKMKAELKAGRSEFYLTAYGTECVVIAPATVHREIAAKLREMYKSSGQN